MHLLTRLPKLTQELDITVETVNCNTYCFNNPRTIDEIVVGGETFLEFDHKCGDLVTVEAIAVKEILSFKVTMKFKPDLRSYDPVTNTVSETTLKDTPGPVRDPYAQQLSGFATHEQHNAAQQQYYANLAGPGTNRVCSGEGIRPQSIPKVPYAEFLDPEHTRFITLPGHEYPVMVNTRGPQGCGKTKVLDMLEQIVSIVKAKI